MHAYRKIIVLFLLLFSAGKGSLIFASSYVSAASGNWSSLSTWLLKTGASTTTAAAQLPGASDDVIIDLNHIITVDVNASCKTISFSSSNVTATGTISVNSGCTLTLTTIFAPAQGIGIKNTCDYNITGQGTVTCANFKIGNTVDPGGSGTTVVRCTTKVSTLNITGSLFLEGSYSSQGNKYNNPTLEIQGGTLNLSGSITTRDSAYASTSTVTNTYTVTTKNAAANVTVNLSGNTPWSLAQYGTNNILLDGNATYTCTFNYCGSGTQQVLATKYKNLKLSGTGTKSIVTGNMAPITGYSSGTVQVAGSYSTGGDLTVSSTTGQSPTPSYSSGTTPDIEYTGTSAITAGSELPNTINQLKINNPGGVTLGHALTVTTLIIGDQTANSIFSDGGYQITPGASGSLTITNGTFNVGGNGSAPSFPAFSSVTIGSGSTVGYISSLAQTVYPLTYQNLVLGGSGIKTTANVTVNGTLYMRGTASASAVPAFGTSAGIEYNGSSPQITDIELPSSINKITVNNAAGVTLNKSVSAAAVDFLSGRLNLASYSLTIPASGTITNAGSAKYIVTGTAGHLIQNVPSANTNVTYPVGTASAYAPVVLNNSGGTSDNYSVQVSSSTSNFTAPAYAVGLQWIINESVPGGSSVTPKFQWNGTDEGASFSSLRTSAQIGKYDGSWTLLATTVTGSDPYSAQTSGPLSAASDFSTMTYAVLQPLALPVELISLTAALNGSDIAVRWTTATEVNCFGFEIERNASGTWEKIGFINGSGNSNVYHNYTFTDKNPGAGKLLYRLRQIDIDGHYTLTDAVEVYTAAPKDFKLMQNSPNPFNPSTSIKFQLPVSTAVIIKIYDAAGKEVRTLVNSEKPAGSHIVFWNGKDEHGEQVSSGIYLYRIQAGHYSETRKMNLLR